ncbi:MAG: efflux RND transporter periplasmic adaptor subunit, partial [Lentisphaeria bacterium]|nr:efflux RND transporter periplasmic adaptor subunit [Lentisphaeria bacterium]
KTEFILQKAARTDLELTIAATGTVEPEELVNVGAQVGGMITTLGTDVNGNTINYGSEVKAGMVLARIDDALYQTELQSANAQLKQAQKKNAEAGILQAKAKVAETTANQKKVEVALKKSELSWERAKNLHRGNASTASEFEEAAAAYLSAKTEQEAAVASVESAKANLSAAESALQTADAQISSAEAQISSADAQISAAEAQISAAEASLSRAKRNLEYCVIKSPVDGVIIDRRVNVGQTVNSSMSAPSLFLIAKDLKKMQVWVSVNEADIKRIQPGQKAVFSVDAIPNEQFEGVVSKIRLNATMSQNVVTYVVEITTDNSSLKLLPYLTANVKFVLDSRKNVLAVPNAAFRFKPEDIAAPEVGKGQRVLWIAGDGGKPQPVVVRTGLNDGRNVEIVEVVSGDLKDGSDVITGSRVVSEKDPGKDAAAGQNPFMAKPPARGGKK